MRAFGVDGSAPNTNGTTILYVAGHDTTPVRGGLYDIEIGCRATPAEQAAGYQIQRLTAENATPGGTAKTPQALDPGGPAASANAVSDPTGEPTYTANAILLMIDLHQRATHRWVAASERRMPFWPGSANNGLGLLGVSPTTAFTVETTFHFEE